MAASRLTFWTLLGVSFLLALILSVFPLPYALRWWRPEFVLVVVIYWMLLMPLSISLVSICLLGLFQDLLESVPFGQHSLGLVLIDRYNPNIQEPEAIEYVCVNHPDIHPRIN